MGKPGRKTVKADVNYEWGRFKPYNEEGVYSFEVNPLKPANPFDISTDMIDAFHFDIYRAVRLRRQR
ncbi:hypothetical protein KV564_17460 [Paenibacillus chitinolyticus]|nr:hypothetical protein [Paenibacillus chitinolyticus]